MSVAVPPASLYAHHVYRQGLHSSAPEAIRTCHRSQYRTAEWLEVRTRLNRAPGYDATRHIPTITGTTDASPQAWGGLVRNLLARFPFSEQQLTFRQSGTMHTSTLRRRLRYTRYLKLATTTHSSCLKRSTAVDDADNEAMYDACKK